MKCLIKYLKWTQKLDLMFDGNKEKLNFRVHIDSYFVGNSNNRKSTIVSVCICYKCKYISWKSQLHKLVALLSIVKFYFIRYMTKKFDNKLIIIPTKYNPVDARIVMATE